MRLISKRDESGVYNDLTSYYFEKPISTAEDVHSLLLFLQTEGYNFSEYEVFFDHDHTESGDFIKPCYSTEELLNVIEAKNEKDIAMIGLYGNVRGGFFPDEGLVNISIPKNRQR